MTSRDTARVIISRLVDAYNSKDAEAMALLYAPDVKYWSALGGVNQGREAVLEHVETLFRELPDEQMASASVVTDGDTVVAEFKSTGSDSSGVPYEIGFTEVIELRDGLLTDIKVYLDPDDVERITG